MKRNGSVSGVLLLFITIGVCRCQDFGDRNTEQRNQKKSDLQTQLTYLQTQLASVLERIASTDQRFNALEHRITALDHRITSLDQRVQALGRRVSSQSPPDSARKQQWEEELLSDASSDIVDILGQEKMAQIGMLQTQADDTGAFRLIRVVKKDVDYAYIVTMFYQSAVMPEIMLKTSSYPARLKKQKPGVATVYIPKEVENGPEPSVYFIFPDYFVTIRLNVNSQDNMYVPLVSLKIAQGNDVKFSSGRDVRLNFAFHVEGDIGNVESESANAQLLVKSEEEEETVDRYRYFYVNSWSTNLASKVRLKLTDLEGSKGNRQGTVLISSFGSDVEGILEVFITVKFNCSVNCLVKQTTTKHHVKFHRDDHEGPFPTSFLGFVHDDYKRNRNRLTCGLGPYEKVCAILCEVAGNRLTSMNIEKVGGSDVDSSRTYFMTVGGGGGYWGSAMMAFRQLREEDGGDYRCTARSGGREIAKNVTLLVERRGHN